MPIFRIAGQKTGTRNTGASGTLAMPADVTNGDTVLVISVSYRDSVDPGNHSITKSAGTATIGTVVNDKRYTVTSGSAHYILEINRVPITATGSLTVGFGSTNAASWAFSVNEYSGIDAIDGSAIQNNGSSTVESTGNITGHPRGLVVWGSSEIETGTVAHIGYSAILVYENQDNTNYTSLASFDWLMNTNETVAFSCTIPSKTWYVVGAAYKPAETIGDGLLNYERHLYTGDGVSRSESAP